MSWVFSGHSQTPCAAIKGAMEGKSVQKQCAWTVVNSFEATTSLTHILEELKLAVNWTSWILNRGLVTETQACLERLGE